MSELVNKSDINYDSARLLHDKVFTKMTPNEFIISKLQSFIHDFPETRVRYEHDKLSDTHFVEVVPNEVYYLSERYIAWESKMFDEFVDQFPHENIGFISDNALVGLENIDFELKGLYFDMPYISSTKSIIIEETNCYRKLEMQ